MSLRSTCMTPFIMPSAGEPSGEASNELTAAAESREPTSLLGQSGDGMFVSQALHELTVLV